MNGVRDRLLDREQLERLCARAERSGLASPDRRTRLIAGLDPALVARLRVHDRPADQLMSDLEELVSLPSSDALGTWLRAAERLVHEREVRRELARLRRQLADPSDAIAEADTRPALRLIPAGRFSRGSLDDEPGRFADESPLHQVELTRALLMARTPTTRAQYRRVLDRHPGDGHCDAPVTGVRWRDAIAYCNALSQREELELVYAVSARHVEIDWDADGYRLPTEAEWEYACRAGTSTRFWSGDDDADALDVGEFGAGDEQPGPVGQRPANPWGLCDLHGGVWEWCADGEAPYRLVEPQIDPVGPLNGLHKIVRGGSLRDPPRYARSACRGSHSVGHRADDLGFRIARLA